MRLYRVQRPWGKNASIGPFTYYWLNNKTRREMNGVLNHDIPLPHEDVHLSDYLNAHMKPGQYQQDVIQKFKFACSNVKQLNRMITNPLSLTKSGFEILEIEVEDRWCVIGKSQAMFRKNKNLFEVVARHNPYDFLLRSKS